MACLKFNHPIDAIALLVQAVKITLPLNNGTVGEPIVYPSTYLLKFIESFNPATYQLEYRGLGKKIILRRLFWFYNSLVRKTFYQRSKRVGHLPHTSQKS